MSRKLVSIVKIASCDPIPETERLSVAKMVGKGWQVVVGRDEFKPDDVCLYFEIDSFIPATDERFAFLKERCLHKFVTKSGTVLHEGLKIKSIKLRGVVSQGLIMPLGRFPEVTDNIIWNNEKKMDEFVQDGKVVGPAIGADVTTILKVEHYDEVQERLQPLTGNPISSEAMGPFPSLMPKTDEERIQNLGDWFSTMKGRLWQVTQKHDGTSCTISYSPMIDPNDPEVVCSRNQRLKKPGPDGKVGAYWYVESHYDILGKLKRHLVETGHEIALQGEIVGPGINKCRNKETEIRFYVFRAWDIKTQKFLNPKDLVKLCAELSIPHVNVVSDEMPFFDLVTTMEDALKSADGMTPEGHPREGIVLKTVDDGPFYSFKIVSNKYLLKSEE